jgi:predicted outer membrane protein
MQGAVGALIEEEWVSTSEPSLRRKAQSDLALLRGLSTDTGTPPTTPGGPSSATLSSQDLQTVAKAYSTTIMERFLAQLTATVTRNSSVHSYAEKLISDHEQEAVQIGNYAQATGTYLPASIQGQDVQTSQGVLSAASRRNYNVVYLRTMVQTHTQDIQENRQTIATTQNPVLKQYAMDDLGTDFLHRLGAATLLRR